MLQFGATLLVLVAIGAVQDTLGSKFVYDTSVPGLPCPPGAPCASGQEYAPYKPQYKRIAKFPFKKSPSKEISCLNTFFCTFYKAVETTPVLKELFEFFTHCSAKEFCANLFPKIVESFVEIGAENPEYLAQKAVETITENFDWLPYDIMIQVHAFSIAKYLFTESILTTKNVVQLAKKYAAIMEEGAKCGDTPYAALRDGYVNFLKSLGLYTPENALLISLQYANEWKLAAKPPSLKYGCGNLFYS